MAGIKYINNIPVCDKEMRDKLAALKELLDGKANKIHTHDEYITRDELEENYVTKAYVDTKFLEIDDLIDDIDLNIYVTKQEVEGKGYLTSIPSEYITESELNAMGFITSNQDVSSLATITTVDNKIAETKTFIDDTYALKSDADALKAWAERLRQEVDDLYNRYNSLRARVNELQNKPSQPEPENPTVKILRPTIILESSVSIFDKEKMYDADPNTYGYFRATFNEEFTIRFDSSKYPASTFKRLVFKVYQSYDADTNFQVDHGMNAQYWSGHRYFEYSEAIHEISFESESDFEYDIHDGDFYLTVRFGGNPGYIMGTEVEIRIYDIYMEF